MCETRVPEQTLSIDEWVTDLLPDVLGVPAQYAISASKLDYVAEALTLPTVRIGGRPLYADFPAKAAAQMTRLIRGKVVRFGNAEVAIATAARYLARNGLVLSLPPVAAEQLGVLVERVAKGEASEAQLASFLDRYLTSASEPPPQAQAQAVLLYVSIAEAAGDTSRRQGLYRTIDRSATETAGSLPEPVDLATTSPGLIQREPEVDWQQRRGVLVRGDRDVLSPEQSRPAAGMVALTADGGDTGLGLELAMIGARGPVLLLHPEEEELSDAVVGYASVQGNVETAPFRNHGDIAAHVANFVRTKWEAMLALARQRRDAAITATPLQHRLRRRWVKLDELGVERVLTRTGFTPAYILELVTEPAAYARAELCDIRLLANELGEPFEDHVSRPPAPRLSIRQQGAWFLASRRRRLPSAEAISLRERGEALLARPHNLAGLNEPEDWEALLPLRVGAHG